MISQKFYVVRVDPEADVQCCIFRVCDKRVNEWLWEFYLNHGCDFEYQFGLLCNDVKVNELESLARSNYDNGNMVIPDEWSVE